MTIDAVRFQKLLDAFKLEQLFNTLGRDHASLKPQQLAINCRITRTTHQG